jgi:hypothetical protein
VTSNTDVDTSSFSPRSIDRLLPPSVQNHFRAGSREALRDRKTETAVCAGDQRDLAGKIEGLLHVRLSVLREVDSKSSSRRT